MRGTSSVGRGMSHRPTRWRSTRSVNFMDGRRLLDHDQRLVLASVEEEHRADEPESHSVLAVRTAEQVAGDARIRLPRNLLPAKRARGNIPELTVRTDRWLHRTCHIPAVRALLAGQSRRFGQFHVFLILVLLDDLANLCGELGGELKVRSSVLISVGAVQRVDGVNFDRRMGPQVPADIRGGSQLARTIILGFDRNVHPDRHDGMNSCCSPPA